MSQVLFVAKIGTNELRIEAANRSNKPFTLECNLDRRGSRAYLELPRSYQTVRGAKLAATRLLGGDIDWKSTDSTPGTILQSDDSRLSPLIAR